MSKAEKNYQLRQARELRGWTQKDVADQIELPDVRTFRRWEGGEASPSLRYRAKLCTLFDMSPEELGFVTATTPRQQPSTPPLSEEERQDDFTINGAQAHGTAMLSTRSTRQWNRQRFLERVYTFWIKEVLECSFHARAPIALRWQYWQEVTMNPWNEVIERAGGSPVDPFEHDEPINECSILQAYDNACGALLILGKTGAGKTTLLLELARELLVRAMNDEAHPLPVVFQLACWQDMHTSSAGAGSLAEWIVEELNSKYYVPKRIGAAWVEQDAILPLLDGLEEVPSSQRGACIEAINAYRTEHGLVPMVVCCHKDEYLEHITASASAGTPASVGPVGTLALSHTLCIQSLSSRQIDEYVRAAGESFEDLRLALRNDRDLRQMVTTPLALRTIMRAYEDGICDLKQSMSDVSLRERRKQVCVPYVECMIERHKGRYPYSLQQSMRWLSRLAQQIQQSQRANRLSIAARHSSEHSVEYDGSPDYIGPHLQLHWLPTARLQRVCLGVFLGLWSALLSGGLIGLIAVSQGDAALQALVLTPALALLTGCLTGSLWALSPLSANSSLPRALAGVLLAMALGGGCLPLVQMLPGGTSDALVWAATIGLTISLFFVFLYLKDWSFDMHASATTASAETVQERFFSHTTIAWMLGVGVLGGWFGWCIAQLGAQILAIEWCALIALCLARALSINASTRRFATLIMLVPGMRKISSQPRTMKRASSSVLLRHALITLCTWLFLLAISVPLLWIPIGLTPRSLLYITLACTLASWLFTWLWTGGEACLQQGLLRCMLWMLGYIPWNYNHFLKCASEQMLLSKSKRGYRFTNRLLLDYFASLEEGSSAPAHELVKTSEQQEVLTA